jgi:hypothetical protein
MADRQEGAVHPQVRSPVALFTLRIRKLANHAMMPDRRSTATIWSSRSGTNQKHDLMASFLSLLLQKPLGFEKQSVSITGSVDLV